MKKYIIIFTVFWITVISNCSKDKYTEISFHEHNPYFLVTSYEIDSIGSFFVIHDTAAFNKVFHPAGGMFEEDWIYPNYFIDSVVISVYKRFHQYQYKIDIKKISHSGEIIRVDYDCYITDSMIHVSKVGDIVMAERLSWDKVNFYENGKFIKQVTEPFQ